MSPRRWMVLAAAIAAMWAGVAYGQQNCVGRPDFDACMARALAAAQGRTAAAQQDIWQSYLRQYGPWLRQQYSQYRGPMTFEQFAYWHLMTANGTDLGGAQRAQEDRFRGSQRAHETVQEGHRSYNQGMYNNSERTSRTAENYNQGAIRGNVAQIDPRTGQELWLPYAQPYNRPFTSGGQTYVQNERGYFVWNGGGWLLMQPAR
jgi:hypothetical protein